LEAEPATKGPSSGVYLITAQLLEEAEEAVRAKLDNVLPDEQRHEVAWARRTLLATGLHRADHAPLVPLLEKLRRATRERRRVRAIYRGRQQPQPIEREVDPYALVHRWGWWYIVGYCHLRQAHRSFRVDRVVELTLLDEMFNVPDDFDVQAYLAAEPHVQPTIRVRLRFAPEGALLALDDRAMWDSLDEQDDGSVTVTFAVPNLEAAARTVLSYAPHAVVLEPDELRAEVSERARAVVAQYGSVE
jgi:predicted DNA-binding transcriptional regulator YafY